MADLSSGHFPQSPAAWAMLGQPANVYQGNIPGRTNLEWPGCGPIIATGTLVSTGVGAAVAVPIDPGTVVTAITMYVTATAASTPTHSFAALYAGTGAAPALIAQTPDTLTAVIAANAAFTFTFATPQIITQAQAPKGFVYVSISQTGSTICTVAGFSGPTIGAWGTMVPPTGAPLFFSATHGSSLAGTAAATIASPSNVTACPLVVIT